MQQSHAVSYKLFFLFTIYQLFKAQKLLKLFNYVIILLICCAWLFQLLNSFIVHFVTFYS